VVIPFNTLRPQHQDLREELLAAVAEVIDSGWFILGEQVQAFEREFADYCGVAHAVGVGSGTEALHLGLLACDVGPGDEVITVAFTAVATVTAIAQTGATPILVDIDPQTYTIDPNQIEARITPRTKVIIPVDLYGHPADLGPIREIAARHGIRVLEDAAQAQGARYRGSRVGALADLTAFSFYPTKNLGACGDAGLLTTDDPALAERLRLLRDYGQRTRYVHESFGVNSRLDELQAALLRVKLPRLDGWNGARRARACRYNELLTGVVTPQAAPWAEPVWHLYVVRSPERDALQRALAEHGIGTLIHYPIPVHLQESYRGLGITPGSLPYTEAFARQILSLPLFPELSLEAIGTVAERINAFAESR
jgi:dTDP-4-amino-4,6-dideoxygalactose transaminase